MTEYIENFSGFEKVYIIQKTPFQKIIDSLLDKIPIDLLKIILRFSDFTDMYFNDIVQCNGGKNCQEVILAPVLEYSRCPQCIYKSILSSKLS